MITTFYPPYGFGGDAMYVQRLVSELAARGHSVDVIHCADSFRMFERNRPVEAPSPPAGVTIHTLESGYGMLSPLLSHQTGRPLLKSGRIAAILASKHFDVIHYHNISLFGPGVFELNPPYSGAVKLYTMHEHWLVCPTSVMWKWNTRACDKEACFGCTLLAGRPPQWWRYTHMRDLAAARIHRFFSPSAFTRDLHHRRGFPFPIHVLPHFTARVDADWRYPAPRPHAKPYFLFVGRLEKIKGVQSILQAFAGPGAYDLLICGTGTYEPQLRALTANMPRVKFAGNKDQSELGAYYYNAIALVVPSLTYETFGMITIEAFARKTPVIVRDLGALSEIVAQSSGGFAFAEPRQLEQQLARLARDPILRERMGEAGYEAFNRLWSPDRHLGLYLDQIAKLKSEVTHSLPLTARPPVLPCAGPPPPSGP